MRVVLPLVVGNKMGGGKDGWSGEYIMRQQTEQAHIKTQITSPPPHYRSTRQYPFLPVNVSADTNVAMLVAVGAHVPSGDGIGGSAVGAGAGACCRERSQRRRSSRSNGRSSRGTTSEEARRRVSRRGAVSERAEEGGGHCRQRRTKNELVLHVIFCAASNLTGRGDGQTRTMENLRSLR